MDNIDDLKNEEFVLINVTNLEIRLIELSKGMEEFEEHKNIDWLKAKLNGIIQDLPKIK